MEFAKLTTAMAGGTEEINFHGLIQMVDTQVTDILVVLSYWRHGNYPLSDHMKQDV